MSSKGKMDVKKLGYEGSKNELEHEHKLQTMEMDWNLS